MKTRRTFQILLIILFNINKISTKKSFNVREYAKGAWAYSTEIKIQCFSSDSLIHLSNGEYKKISKLKSGDKILTMDQSNIISTEMIMMLHKHKSEKVLFYNLKTKSGHEISLTEYHLLPILSLNNTKIYLFTKQIQLGDLLFVLSNNKIEYSPIINITKQIKNGFYAPLTMKGTLLVNNILSSCFAYAKDHYSAQFYMFPFRFYYKLTKIFNLNSRFDKQQSKDLHWLIQIMFLFGKYFRPDTLF